MPEDIQAGVFDRRAAGSKYRDRTGRSLKQYFRFGFLAFLVRQFLFYRYHDRMVSRLLPG
ncbi:MAG: hypothetical protein JWP00_3905 [Chloroflexi bacterium]|jgi:hypothetical protein|nr:hypothetical protein [Chloroflexota bacterium]